MITNYLKIALRSISKNRLTSFINIAGLALAITVAVLIYLFIADEESYDRYHKNASRVYRVNRNFLNNEGTSVLNLANVAPPIGPLIKNDFGEVQEMARTLNYRLVMAIEENGERKKMVDEEKVFMAEPEIFKILDIGIKVGTETALTRPRTVMLSAHAAQKYFGTTDIIGKHLKGGRLLDLEVTGVFENFPPQTHWHPDFLISFSTLNDSTIYGRKQLETSWGNNAFSTYLLLTEGTHPDKIRSRLPAFLDRHFGPYARANWGAPPDFVASKMTILSLQNVKDIHLYSHLDDELEANGNSNNVLMMGIIGILIVLIACFNFINLATARATNRAKEVGLRKAVGAFKTQLINQYLTESVLVTFISLALAIGILWIALDWLNRFTDKSISFHFIQNWKLTLGLIGSTLLLGILAGIYPAFIISNFNTSLVLKGQLGSNSGKGMIRKFLVVAQFTVSIALITATSISRQQLQYLNNQKLGYEKESVISLPFYTELGKNYDAFYNELFKSSAIKNASRTSRIPTGRLLDSMGGPWVMQGDSLMKSNVEVKYITTDQEFFNTYGINFVAGRPFSKSIVTDDSLAFIINESAARTLGMKSMEASINKDFKYGDVKGKLIGIVNDFHFESLHQDIVPMIFLPVKQSYYNYLSVKIASGDMQGGINHLEKVWKEFLPTRPFDYQFISDKYKNLYQAETKENQLFSIASLLAIFIACLGLFGLATFSTLQRIKEIGIRKVMGASLVQILHTLSKEIVILVIVANVIAWPLAWYFMNQWLGTFAYHTDVNWISFGLSGAITLFLALITISTQTIKAAMTNPSSTLRYE